MQAQTFRSQSLRIMGVGVGLLFVILGLPALTSAHSGGGRTGGAAAVLAGLVILAIYGSSAVGGGSFRSRDLEPA